MASNSVRFFCRANTKQLNCSHSPRFKSSTLASAFQVSQFYFPRLNQGNSYIPNFKFFKEKKQGFDSRDQSKFFKKENTGRKGKEKSKSKPTREQLRQKVLQKELKKIFVEIENCPSAEAIKEWTNFLENLRREEIGRFSFSLRPKSMIGAIKDFFKTLKKSKWFYSLDQESKKSTKKNDQPEIRFETFVLNNTGRIAPLALDLLSTATGMLKGLWWSYNPSFHSTPAFESQADKKAHSQFDTNVQSLRNQPNETLQVIAARDTSNVAIGKTNFLQNLLPWFFVPGVQASFTEVSSSNDSHNHGHVPLHIPYHLKVKTFKRWLKGQFRGTNVDIDILYKGLHGSVLRQLSLSHLLRKPKEFGEHIAYPTSWLNQGIDRVIDCYRRSTHNEKVDAEKWFGESFIKQLFAQSEGKISANSSVSAQYKNSSTITTTLEKIVHNRNQIDPNTIKLTAIKDINGEKLFLHILHYMKTGALLRSQCLLTDWARFGPEAFSKNFNPIVQTPSDFIKAWLSKEMIVSGMNRGYQSDEIWMEYTIGGAKPAIYGPMPKPGLIANLADGDLGVQYIEKWSLEDLVAKQWVSRKNDEKWTQFKFYLDHYPKPLQVRLLSNGLWEDFKNEMSKFVSSDKAKIIMKNLSTLMLGKVIIANKKKISIPSLKNFHKNVSLVNLHVISSFQVSGMFKYEDRLYSIFSNFSLPLNIKISKNKKLREMLWAGLSENEQEAIGNNLNKDYFSKGVSVNQRLGMSYPNYGEAYLTFETFSQKPGEWQLDLMIKKFTDDLDRAIRDEDELAYDRLMQRIHDGIILIAAVLGPVTNFKTGVLLAVLSAIPKYLMAKNQDTLAQQESDFNDMLIGLLFEVAMEGGIVAPKQLIKILKSTPIEKFSNYIKNKHGKLPSLSDKPPIIRMSDLRDWAKKIIKQQKKKPFRTLGKGESSKQQKYGEIEVKEKINYGGDTPLKFNVIDEFKVDGIEYRSGYIELPKKINVPINDDNPISFQLFSSYKKGDMPINSGSEKTVLMAHGIHPFRSYPEYYQQDPMLTKINPSQTLELSAPYGMLTSAPSLKRYVIDHHNINLHTGINVINKDGKIVPFEFRKTKTNQQGSVPHRVESDKGHVVKLDELTPDERFKYTGIGKVDENGAVEIHDLKIAYYENVPLQKISRAIKKNLAQNVENQVDILMVTKGAPTELYVSDALNVLDALNVEKAGKRTHLKVIACRDLRGEELVNGGYSSVYLNWNIKEKLANRLMLEQKDLDSLLWAMRRSKENPDIAAGAKNVHDQLFSYTVFEDGPPISTRFKRDANSTSSNRRYQLEFYMLLVELNINVETKICEERLLGWVASISAKELVVVPVHLASNSTSK